MNVNSLEASPSRGSSLSGRRALVTGAGRGLGTTIAAALNECGVHTVLTGRDEAALRGAASTMYGPGETAILPADLRDTGELAELSAKAWDIFGGIDIVINNAGTTYPESVRALTPEAWDSTLQVNLTAPAIIAADMGSRMAGAESGGCIINIGSTAAIMPVADHYSYCVSKAGLAMATRVLAMELGSAGVRVNMICPTVVWTDMGREVWGDDEKSAPLLARTPLGHFAHPSDVAGAVLYLASPEAQMITGTLLPIDGGLTAV